jgi:hypothetical protein
MIYAYACPCRQLPKMQRKDGSCLGTLNLCDFCLGCGDSHPRCAAWASRGQFNLYPANYFAISKLANALLGECQANAQWMKSNCQLSCGSCSNNFGAAECDVSNAGS